MFEKKGKYDGAWKNENYKYILAYSGNGFYCIAVIAPNNVKYTLTWHKNEVKRKLKEKSLKFIKSQTGGAK